VKSKFKAEYVTDAKRVARGEQYLAARALLRSRSTERVAPRILILAGGSPEEELGTIRELWKGQWRAHVTAVDRVEENVALAVSAGADEGFVGELARRETENTERAHENLVVPKELVRHGKFDLLHLDFCGLLTDELRKIVRLYHRRALSAGGAIIAAFSYGHDVAEAYLAVLRGGRLVGHPGRGTLALIKRGVPETVCGRIAFLTSNEMLPESIVLYQGNQVPMCSILFSRRRQDEGWPRDLDGDSSHISVAKIGDHDLLDAVEQFDAASLYALPEQRLAAMRRSAAAKKAVATRIARTEKIQAPVAPVLSLSEKLKKYKEERQQLTPAISKIDWSKIGVPEK